MIKVLKLAICLLSFLKLNTKILMVCGNNVALAIASTANGNIRIKVVGAKSVPCMFGAKS